MPTRNEAIDAAIAAATMCTIWFAAIVAVYCALTGTFTI